MRKKFVLSIAILGAAYFTAPSPAFSGKALFYETFEEYDFRDVNILPEGKERVRIHGRVPGTEMEIEAPSGGAGTASLAQFVPDPSGLSLVVLKLRDNGDDPGNGDFGAGGGLSLLESILLDQGDYRGKSIVSWMAIPFQSNEPGGAMFPETDTRIDPGPEGLNLIGFGGISRDFDTGEILNDFSDQITLNVGGGAEISPLGVGYKPNIPTFFTLVFDLETSQYDIYINGVLVETGVPFFDIAGETGKTLRELELISSVRGLGTFAYDNLLQLDPDRPYTPLPFRTPLVSNSATVIPLFMEDFEDENLGSLPAKGDLVGSRITPSGGVQVALDSSNQTLARAALSQGSAIEARYIPVQDAGDELRVSFTVTPQTGSLLSLNLNQNPAMRILADGFLSIDSNGDGSLETTTIQILSGLPHWFTFTLNPITRDFAVNLYRATSPSDAQTVLLTATGKLSGQGVINTAQWHAEQGSVFVDNLLGVVLNNNPSVTDANTYRAAFSEDFESQAAGLSTLGGQVVNDPSVWSLRRLEADTQQTIPLFTSSDVRRSARLSWTAVPLQTGIEASALTVHYTQNGVEQSRKLIGLLSNGKIGADTNGDNLLEALNTTYSAWQALRLSVVLDLSQGIWSAYLNGSATPLAEGSLTTATDPLTLTGAELSGQSGGRIQYDDLLVVADASGAQFEPLAYKASSPGAGVQVLFDENFENNPARSEQVINPDDARKSGLPIETSSKGFSNFSETDIANTDMVIGAPSAESVYIEDPDGGSLYSLHLADHYAPKDFSGFQNANPVNPISTLRTTPYAFVIPQLAQSPTARFVQIRWQSQAHQIDKTGLALFLQTQTSNIYAADIPAPAGSPVVAYGDAGKILADLNGDGNLESTSLNYTANVSQNFNLVVDRQSKTFNLTIDGQSLAANAPLKDDPTQAEFLQSFGWFTTLVSNGSSTELQQSMIGGGAYVMDDIRVVELSEVTSVNDFVIY